MLLWYKEFNREYKDILIDYITLDSMDNEVIAPVNIENDNSGIYCINDKIYNENIIIGSPSLNDGVEGDVVDVEFWRDIFDTIVVTDVDGCSMLSTEMTSMALKHLKDGHHFLEMRHGAMPMSDYNDPKLYTLLYPTLFPYGCGSPDGLERRKISFKGHIQHLFWLRDLQFHQHHLFMFVVFNVLKRHTINMSATILVKRLYVSSIANDLGNISVAAIDRTCDRLKTGDFLLPSTASDEELTAVKLMRDVNLVNAKVPGTSGSKLKMRNKIRAMCLGIPSYYIINLTDTHNPIVKLMFRDEIDLNNMTMSDVLNVWVQFGKVADNPFVLAKLFNLYLSILFKHVLGYNKRKDEHKMGALGILCGYYGCVEDQGRGRLHCHMLFGLWVVCICEI